MLFYLEFIPLEPAKGLDPDNKDSYVVKLTIRGSMNLENSNELALARAPFSLAASNASSSTSSTCPTSIPPESASCSSSARKPGSSMGNSSCSTCRLE
jgi:hypothetical protein